MFFLYYHEKSFCLLYRYSYIKIRQCAPQVRIILTKQIYSEEVTNFILTEFETIKITYVINNLPLRLDKSLTSAYKTRQLDNQLQPQNHCRYMTKTA